MLPGMAKRLNDQVARRLTAIREVEGLTPLQAAKRLGVSKPRWQNWERGDNLPLEDVAVRICEEFHVTLDWLFRGIPDGLTVSRSIQLLAAVERVPALGASPPAIGKASRQPIVTPTK